MSMKPAKIQFNGGELSPWLAARTDIAKYDKTAKLCRNFIPLTEGSLKRRGGTCFVAETPEAIIGVRLKISPTPAHAEVFINHAKTDTLAAERGDTLFYEVRAKGYVTTSGSVTVINNTELEVKLVSEIKRHTLTIATTPASAKVKINGVVRKTYAAADNEEVRYVVYKDYYLPQRGTLVLKEDKTLNVALSMDEVDTYDYGAWGDPLAFIACTLYGGLDELKKCFLICFENGYLPVLFDAKLRAPRNEDFIESRFIADSTQGYNTLYKSAEGVDTLGVMRLSDDGVFYDNLSGQAVTGFDFLSLKKCGFPVEDRASFEEQFQDYEAYTTGGGIKVCYQGEIVWALKGRSNG